jgi:CMP-N,N'-diacetyllegionaminic acid synthase
MIHVLIPARGNSKGVKNKNIVKINGKELIYYTINIAKKLKNISKIVVSTDSEKIAKIAKKYGADVPFIRPKKYARDNSTDLEVFQHYVGWLKNYNFQKPNLIIHLRPTTPFRSLKVINLAINIIKKNKNISSLRSMKKSNFSPYKMWHINKRTGFAYPVIIKKNELHSMARQKLTTSYDHIGYVDILRVRDTINKNSMTGKKIFPFILQKKSLKKFIDIDTMYDLSVARKINKK